MDRSKDLSRRKLATISVISLCAGVIGTLISKIFGSAQQTSPAWIGPAILIGSVALVLVGVLLLPVAIREFKAASRGPAD